MYIEAQKLPNRRNTSKLVRLQIKVRPKGLHSFTFHILIFAFSLLPSTTVEDSLQIALFMQNKANFPDDQMNVNKVLTKDYENKTPIRAPKKQSQISKRQKPMQTSLPQRIMENTAISGPEKTNPIQTKFSRIRAIRNKFECSNDPRNKLRRISCSKGDARQFRLDSSWVFGYLISTTRLLANDDTLKKAGSAGFSRPIPAGADTRIGAG